MPEKKKVAISILGKEFQSRLREALGSACGIEEKIAGFTALLSEFTDGAAVHVLLFAEELGEFILKGSTQRWRTNAGPPRFAAGGTAEFLAIKEKRTIYLQEAQRTSSSALKAQCFIFPLALQDPIVGVVTVVYLSEKGLDARRVVFAERAARQLGETVLQALREESTAQEILKVSAISEAGVTIISARELSNLVQLIVAITPMIMEAESCVLRLFDAETRRYTVRDLYGIRKDEIRKALLHLDRLVAFEVVKTGQPLLIRNVAETARYREHGHYARTLICHPLLRDGQVIGTVTLFNRIGNGTLYQGHFTQGDLAATHKLLKYAEKAIVNAMAADRSEELKTHDDLTGLPNLKHFQKRLLEELNRAQRFGRKLALIFCETSAEPGRTDLAGPQQTDGLVCQLADSIRKSIRQYDIVGRMGEYKFGIILPEVENGTGVALARIRKRLEKSLRELGAEKRLQMAFSHATYPDDGEKYEQLVFDHNLF